MHCGQRVPVAATSEQSAARWHRQSAQPACGRTGGRGQHASEPRARGQQYPLVHGWHGAGSTRPAAGAAGAGTRRARGRHRE
eukprot:5125713-Alexandrium_andersonii.AAC.1